MIKRVAFSAVLAAALLSDILAPVFPRLCATASAQMVYSYCSGPKCKKITPHAKDGVCLTCGKMAGGAHIVKSRRYTTPKSIPISMKYQPGPYKVPRQIAKGNKARTPVTRDSGGSNRQHAHSKPASGRHIAAKPVKRPTQKGHSSSPSFSGFPD